MTEPNHATGSAGGHSRSRTLLIGSLSMLAARAVATFGSLVTVGLLARHLSPEDFGLWSVIGSLVVFTASLDLGLGQGLRNRLAVYAARGAEHDQQARSEFYAALTFLILLVLVAGLVWWLLAPLLPWAQVMNVGSPSVAVNLGPLSSCPRTR